MWRGGGVGEGSKGGGGGDVWVDSTILPTLIC